MTTFLVGSIRGLHVQGDRQAAGQLAADGWERVNAMQETSGEPPALPAPETSRINGVAYTVTWQGERRVRKRATVARPEPPCDASADPLAGGDVAYHRVLITVRWPANTCPGDSCTYQTAALMNTDHDPQFEVR